MKEETKKEKRKIESDKKERRKKKKETRKKRNEEIRKKNKRNKEKKKKEHAEEGEKIKPKWRLIMEVNVKVEIVKKQEIQKTTMRRGNVKNRKMN